MSDPSHIDRLVARLPESTRDMLRNVQKLSSTSVFEQTVIDVAARSIDRAAGGAPVPHHFLNTAHVEQRAPDDLAPRTLLHAMTILESGDVTTHFSEDCYASVSMLGDRADILMSSSSNAHAVASRAMCFTVCWSSGPQHWREVVKQYDDTRRFFQQTGAPTGFYLPVRPGSNPKSTPWFVSFLLPGVNSIASQEANDAMIMMGVALMFAVLVRKGL
jgi:hypothetical protein